MKITLFTSNQRRHNSLVANLSKICDTLYVVQECNTIISGIFSDLYKNDDGNKKYFNQVMNSEKKIFGDFWQTYHNVQKLSVNFGDLEYLSIDDLEPCLNSDFYLVFGSSWIKGDLVEHLIKNKAVNIHMGLSPLYRGASCNFWALFDENSGFVGATVHRLSKGLDNGDIIFSVIPQIQTIDPFDLGMQAVLATHNELISTIATGEINKLTPIRQNKDHEIKYSKKSDLNTTIISQYLNNLPSPKQIEEQIRQRDLSNVIRPRFF